MSFPRIVFALATAALLAAAAPAPQAPYWAEQPSPAELKAAKTAPDVKPNTLGNTRMLLRM